MNRKAAGRLSGASVLRTALCVCCALLVLLLTAASALGEELSWEERLEKAREKYNEKTVNVFLRGRGKNKKNMVNVQFYLAKTKNYMSINIRESLQITDEAEIQAVLEVVAKHELFSEEEYGTISFIKAEWITHNLAYEMANGSTDQQSLVALAAGEHLSQVIKRAKELDISPISHTPERELAVYEFIESVYCHKETGQDDP